MECLDDNLITAYVDGQLSEAQRARVTAHLDACATCLTVMCEVARSGPPPTVPGGGPTPPAEEPSDIERGATVGRYRIIEMIGRGGMGAVYLAHDPRLDRRVAIKIVRSRELARAPFQHRLAGEARTMAKVAHPNVVAVYDSGELADGVYIAMELVTGDTLRAWQTRSGRAWREIVRKYLEVGRGLAAAHAAEVVHRDFKPENVLVDTMGRAAVTDFGIAIGSSTDVDTATGIADVGAPGAIERTRTGELIGTPQYMSPEQFAGVTPDARSDQFSFAVALWEALYREHPFGGRTVGELRAEVGRGARRPPPRGTPVPSRVADVIARGLAVEPAARFASMTALLDELARTIAPRRARLAIAAAGVAALAIAGGAFALASMHGPARSPATSGSGTERSGAMHTTVVIAPFTNTTGDPRLDDSLDPIIAEVIARSETIDPIAALDLLRAATAAGAEPTDVDAIAAAVSARNHAPVLVARGTIARDGDGYRITLTEPTTPVALTERAPNLAQVLPAAARIAVGLRRALGDAPPSVPELVSTSVDAVHEAMQGSRLAMAGDLEQAAVRLRHALELDPADTSARITLGLVLYNLSQQTEAVAELERAVAEAERLPERTRLLLLGDYYGTQGKYVEAISAYQRFLARWPGDQRTEINLIAIAIDAGDFPLAYDLSQHVVALHPDVPVVRGNHVIAEVATGRFEAAERDGAAMVRDFPRPPTFALAAVAIAQELLGHLEDAEQTWTTLSAFDAEVADQGRGDLALYQGELAEARARLRPYADRALAANEPLSAVDELLALAAIELRAGDRAAAARYATAAMGSGAVRQEYLAASLAIDAGEVEAAAAKVAAWDDNAIPEWQMFGRMLAGDVARARGAADAAVVAYKDASRLGSSWLARERLGLGYLAAGSWADAERELTWCVEHRGEAGLIMTPTLHLLADAERALAQARDHRR